MSGLESGRDLLEGIDAVLFDMDGVVTDTAEAHAVAWKRLFDEYLAARAERRGEAFRPFDADADYRAYVDGKPRYDGVKSFLESRSVELPRGSADDGPDEETICGLGNRKNRYFREWLERHRVTAFPDTLEVLRTLRRDGIRTAVFSASRNAGVVLESAGVLEAFDAKVDGADADVLGLKGKPDPAMLEEAAARLGVAPERAAVVEDATAGVEAGAAGGFGLVVGVDRAGHAEALREHGADVVVGDTRELLQGRGRDDASTTVADTPSLWTHRDAVERRLADGVAVVFLDYDGTLTPIVDDPDAAVLSAEMRSSLVRLARHLHVGVVSGRDLTDLRELVGIESLYYAGSHGFDIAGPHGADETLQQGTERLATLDSAEAELRERLAGFEGVAVERKRFAIAIHYRRAHADDVEAVERRIDDVLDVERGLRKGHGKEVFQVRPDVDWDKGRAVEWLLERLDVPPAAARPVYVGDDVTDEDAFRAVRGRGVAIVVRDGATRGTIADYALEDPADVEAFLRWLAERAEAVSG